MRYIIVCCFLTLIFSNYFVSANQAHHRDSLTNPMDNEEEKRIWIDTDNGFGRFSEDVDDALALISCLQSERIEIVGISVIESSAYGQSITEKIVKWHQKDIPVYQGALDKNQLGLKSPSTEAIKNAALEGNLTILALGAATNIASSIELFPEIVHSIDEVIFCGGRKENQSFSLGKNQFRVDDSNFELDPEGFMGILNSKIPVTLSGYEASSSIFLTTKDLRPLRRSGEKHHRWMFRKLKRWASFWRLFLRSKQGFMPFDAVTAAYLIAPEDCNCISNMPVKIEWRRNDAKSLLSHENYKYYLEVSPDIQSAHQVKYCEAVEGRFKLKLLKWILPN